VTINQLSERKAHWLAVFSEAFLMRSSDGHAPRGCARRDRSAASRRPRTSVGSLSQSDDAAIVSASSQQPAAARFEFVSQCGDSPVLEQAYADQPDRPRKRRLRFAMIDVLRILEAIVTDASSTRFSNALQLWVRPGKSRLDVRERLAVAEKAGLIRSGCARLPRAARPSGPNGSRR